MSVRKLYQAEYMVLETQPGMVWIIDCDAGARSVTNDAERVVLELHGKFPGCRFFYRDTMGQWDELVHDAGRFIDFRPGAPKVLP